MIRKGGSTQSLQGSSFPFPIGARPALLCHYAQSILLYVTLPLFEFLPRSKQGYNKTKHGV